MSSVFSEKILAEKLSDLNNTQQCIETLSHWCIFHRPKAEQVVQTWDKQFHCLDKEHKIPFLYLANDILQNSKRTGTEFVGEFWKVLPAALKDVVQNGDDKGKNVVSRLVGIWEERKVFGSRAHSLIDLMTGNQPLPSLELSNKKRPCSVRILKRDSRSVKSKLSVGGAAEKIMSAFHTVHSKHPNEDTDLKRCKDAVHRVGKMERSVATACSQYEDPNDPQRAILVNKLREDESILKQFAVKLKSIETCREELVSRLKESLKQQESELENIRTQLQVTEAQTEEAVNMQRRLKNEPTSSSKGTKKTVAAIAAEVADRLTASTHSQQIMSSVLSSFAAEEANKNSTLSTTSTPNSSGIPELENPMSIISTATSMSSSQLSSITPPQQRHQMQTVLMKQQPSMQIQPQYNMYQTPPQAQQQQQYFQSTGNGMMFAVPYTYNTLLPPPPPPQQSQLMSLVRPSQQQLLPQTAPPPPPPTLHQPAPPSYRPLLSPGMPFYQHSLQ